MTNEQRTKALDKIRDRLAEIREEHSDAAQEYIEKKAAFDLELAQRYHNKKGTVNKTDISEEYRSESEGKTLWLAYHDAKALMEKYDREVKNLDAQRSIIQTQLKGN